MYRTPIVKKYTMNSAYEEYLHGLNECCEHPVFLRRGAERRRASQDVMVVNEHSFKFNCSLTWTNCSVHTEILRHSKGDFIFPPVGSSRCLDNRPRRSAHVRAIVITPDFNL